MVSLKKASSNCLLNLLVFYCLHTTKSETEIFTRFFVKSNEPNPISTCILNIVHKYVPCSDFISVVVAGGSYSYEVIKTIHDDLCYSVTLKSSDDKHWIIWTETYIVLTETIDDLSRILSEIANDLYWNPRARFIIYTIASKQNKILEIFNILITRNIYNVVVLSFNGNDVIIHSYDPFRNGKCGRYFEDVINLGECENATNTLVLFSNKEADSMKNCTVKVIAHEDIPAVIFKESNYTVFGKYESGLEQYMLKNIGAYENITYNYRMMRKAKIDFVGLVLPNRTVTGMFAVLQAGLVDMAIGGLMLMKNRADVFEYAWGYNYEQLSLFTPVLDTKSWKNVFKELGPRSWTLTVLCYCLVSTISIVMVTLYPEIVQERLLLIFKLWGFFFQGNSDKGLLKVKRLRLLLCCWIWFTFFITNFYNTALFSMVTSQADIKKSIDIDDLDHLPFKPCISDNLRNLLFYAYDQSLPENYLEAECRNTAESLSEVGSRKDLYTIGIKQNYKLREYEFTNFRGKNTINAWDFSNLCITVIYFKKGHPLKEIIENHAMYMFEAGLIKKQFDKLCLRSHSAIMKKSNSFVRVRLEYLAIHFMVIFAGISISTVVFILEIMIPIFKRRGK